MEIISMEMLRKSTEKIRKKLKNENLCFIEKSPVKLYYVW